MQPIQNILARVALAQPHLEGLSYKMRHLYLIVSLYSVLVTLVGARGMRLHNE
jgi:hypothetical protein